MSGHYPRAAAGAPESSEGTLVRLPPVRVRTTTREVAGFLRETGGNHVGGSVPVTFPARWLALPVIRGLILQMTGGQGFLPVHEAQSFAYDQELQLESDYILAVEARRTAKPPRLTLKIAVSAGQGELCARIETVLRIAPLNLEPAS